MDHLKIKVSEVKSSYFMNKWGSRIWFGFWLVWLVQTLVFWVIAGEWHKEPYNNVEATFDTACAYGMVIGFFLVFWSMITTTKIINKPLMEEVRKKEKHIKNKGAGAGPTYMHSNNIKN
jgi:hypothetical protein